MNNINQFITDNMNTLDFQYWEVIYRSESIPWEEYYTDDFADFNIYGIYINKEKSQQHKDLEEKVRSLEESIKYHNNKLEELLK